MHPHRAVLPVEEVQHLETWREPIAREVEIGLPSSIRGRARSDRSDTALGSTDCLRKHGTHGERRRGGLRCAAITPEAAGTSTVVGLEARPQGSAFAELTRHQNVILLWAVVDCVDVEG